MPHRAAPTGKKVLLVDDEENSLKMTLLALRHNDIHDVVTLTDSRLVPAFLAEHPVALVLLDLYMPHLCGQELLKTIRRDFPGVPVAIVTGSKDLDIAIDCMKLGAVDYLVKPVETNRLVSCVRNALNRVELEREVAALKRRLLEGDLERPDLFSAVITRSKKMRGIFQYIEAVAGSRQPILIQGETGTGKELIAEAIHKASRVQGEFVTVNVAGVDDTMFSDTLFGHTKGAYTGADSAREGFISRAAGGTLFLDEIGDLSEASQIKLLRLLQQNEYYPVGSDLLRKSTARIVLATNVELQAKIEEGRFRRDLYYRLRTHQVHLPPLRQRQNDIPLLALHFAEVGARLYQKSQPVLISPEALELLKRCRLPGNVRELQALVFDAVARHRSGPLMPEDFEFPEGSVAGNATGQPNAAHGTGSLISFFGRFPTMHEVDELLLDEALEVAKGNHNLASKLLGVTRKTVSNRLNARRSS